MVGKRAGKSGAGLASMCRKVCMRQKPTSSQSGKGCSAEVAAQLHAPKAPSLVFQTNGNGA